MKQPPADSELGRLFAQFPRAGRVDWIGLRPARDVPMREVESADAQVGGGLQGDRYAGGSGKRGLTLIQAEHLPAIAMLSGHAAISPATLTACYVTVVVRSRMASLDDSLEEAAMDLGARPWRVFFLITLPLVAPALLAGWLLAFTLSLDDLVIASFTSGPGASTLPMLIYSKVKLGVTPEINALATLIVTVVGLGVVVAGILMHRRERRLSA